MMRALFLLLPLTLAACGTPRQLDRMKDLNARGDFAALAQENVACTGAGAVCSQMHEMKADACLREGQRAAAPGGSLRAAAPSFACAVRSYDAAIAALPSGGARDTARLRTGLLLSLRERRDHGGDAPADNERLIREAAALRPAAPRIADFYEATGRFGRAVFDRSPARCGELAAAVALLGGTPPAKLASAWAGLRSAAMAEQGGCMA